MSPLAPPPLRPATPPGDAPSKWRVTWNSLLGRPTSLTNAGLTQAGTLTGPLELHSTGKPPLKLTRDEVAAAVLTVIEIKRHGATKGFIGLDASDNIVLLKSDGTTVLATLNPSGDWTVIGTSKGAHLIATVDTKSPKYLDGSGTQVVTSQQGGISNAANTTSSGGGSTHNVADPTPATVGDVNGALNGVDDAMAEAVAAHTTASSAVTAVNAVIAALHAHGLIA